ncbi:DNA-binding response regulator [Actinoalloteichus sp. AHMU CJ021]|uniref:Two component transcriptional regulator, LuxR family n=1 Tax=Actinoalloteichus caeruleus DSM 43889 TaxID=1120930 RepID=A0ABT1JHS8_ACTCY|nr:response regulator transcription factor [Actinoalloteichus caeruleus]AUS77799.1 DNA-binding response regulator [Actinoalloteichus sp. AHMU CJ021]MCP2331754.1 two component transcriptional regulator, LuxR family [Actinoalloteichus caeruleus DSM 43889]
MIRVLIADDQSMVRAGFAALLDDEEDIEVVGVAANGEQAVREARATRPDVVLMDVRMPEMNGLEATRRILDPPAGSPAAAPLPRVLMLTTFDIDDYVYEALHSGASGFLLKDAEPEDLVAAVRIVAAGDALLAPSVTRRLVERFAANPRPGSLSRTRLNDLTEREVEVLRLISRGRSNLEIAQDLFVAEATVKTHVGRIFAKLGLRDRAQAVIVAYETGLVAPGSG